uniref:Lipocalin n=1 Tax=Rhipicephalus zambeziensis TaxID=60191 RepID=A0A224YC83_9ACAR
MRAGAVFLIFGLFADVYGASLEDLIEALNTTQTIWLYNQSYQDSPDAPNRTCVSWHLRNIDKSLYTFDNDYKDGREYYTDYNTNATLSETKNNAEMNVTYIREAQSPTSVLYKLNKWDSNDKCFVLTFSNGVSGNVNCELHVWQDKLNDDHTSCDKVYQDLCKEKGREVFSAHDCM